MPEPTPGRLQGSDRQGAESDQPGRESRAGQADVRERLGPDLPRRRHHESGQLEAHRRRQTRHQQNGHHVRNGESVRRCWLDQDRRRVQGRPRRQAGPRHGGYPAGERKIKGKECPELAVWWEVECLREIPINIKLKPPIPYIEKYEKLFLYLDYAKDTLRRDPKGAAVPAGEVDAILKSDPKAGTARLNKRALERLDSLIGQGYWLNSVDGYTSPEGRRPGPKASDRGLAAKLEGNEALSLERAEKTRKLGALRLHTVHALTADAFPIRSADATGRGAIGEPDAQRPPRYRARGCRARPRDDSRRHGGWA